MKRVPQNISPDKMRHNEDIEKMYSALFNNKMNGIAHCAVITDENGQPADYKFLTVNEAYTLMTGLKKENIEGRRATDVFPGIENFSFDFIGNFGNIALHGGELNTQVCFEGLNQWYSCYACSPKKGEFIVMFKDITARKKTEEALEENEQRYKNTLDSMLEGCAILDFNWIYLYVNDVGAMHAHCKKEEMTGRSIFELIPGIEKSALYESVKRSMNERIRQHVEAGFTFEDGSQAWYEVIVQPVPEGIFILTTDITQRKKVEEDLKKSEERFRIAQEVSPDGFVTFRPVFDAQGNIIDFIFTYENEAAARMNGTVPEKVIGRRLLDLFPGHRETQFFRTYKKVYETGKAEEFEDYYSGETISGIWFRILTVPIKDGIAIYSQNITERRKTQEALKDTKEQYDLLFNSVEEGFAHYKAVYDKSGKFIDILVLEINPAGAALSGKSREAQIGRTWKETFTGFEENLLDIYKKVDESGETFIFEHYSGITERWYISKVTRIIPGQFAVTFIDITERKLAELSLLESEKRFHTLADNISQLVWMTDEKGWIFWYNQRWYDYTGTSFDEMQGWGWQKVHDPRYVDKVTKKFKQALDSGSPWEDTFPLRGKDGSYRWFLSRALPIKDEYGKVIRWFGTNTDITEQRKAEEAHAQSEAKLLEAQRLAHVGSYLYDYNTKSLELTEELYRIFGWNPANKNIALNDVIKIIHPDDFPYVTERIRSETDTNISVELEYRIITPGNEVKYLFTRRNPIFDIEGKVVGIFGTSIDITSRKLQEKKLEEAFRLLQESETRLNDAQKLAHVGSFSYELVTGIIEWSEETFNIYEQDVNKPVPSFEAVTALWHPEDLPWIKESIKDGMENNKIINFESRLLLAGNKVKYINYIARPVYDANGKPVKRIGAVADITDRKLQELELRKTLAELQQSNMDLEQFAYVASHDLQEPIRMISTYTKMFELHMNNKLDEKTLQYMFFITDGAKRMHVLIQDLLAYSSITSKKELFVQTDLNSTMAEVLRDLQIAISDHKAEVLYNKLPVIKADTTQIRLVFQNLIQNAIKFKGAEKTILKIEAEQKGREWLFSFKDNGIGIDPEYHKKIFVIFQRLHEKEKYPGTGIGLAICKKIIERHGGRIWVESEVGKGSKFYFTIPV